jgi:hypothetical protein
MDPIEGCDDGATLRGSDVSCGCETTVFGPIDPHLILLKPRKQSLLPRSSSLLLHLLCVNYNAFYSRTALYTS